MAANANLPPFLLLVWSALTLYMLGSLAIRHPNRQQLLTKTYLYRYRNGRGNFIVSNAFGGAAPSSSIVWGHGGVGRGAVAGLAGRAHTHTHGHQVKHQTYHPSRGGFSGREPSAVLSFSRFGDTVSVSPVFRLLHRCVLVKGGRRFRGGYKGPPDAVMEVCRH